MNIFNQIILATTLTFSASSLMAEPLSYTFISADYDTFDDDGAEKDFEGNQIFISGSVSVAANFAVLAGYGTSNTYVTSNNTIYKVNSDTAALGALFHIPVDTSMDFIVGAWLLRNKAEASSALPESVTSNDNDLFLGVRAKAAKWEVNAFIHRVDYENSSIDTFPSFGLGYYIVKDVSLDVGYSFGGDVSSLSFGITKYF